MHARPDPKEILDEDFAVSSEWLDEIRRRCEDIDGGKARLVNGSIVIDELREKYGR